MGIGQTLSQKTVDKAITHSHISVF